MIRKFIAGLVLIASSMATCGQAAAGTPFQNDVPAEDYAVYDAVMARMFGEAEFA